MNEQLSEKHKSLGIDFDGDKFTFGEHKYSKLNDALAYAEKNARKANAEAADALERNIKADALERNSKLATVSLSSSSKLLRYLWSNFGVFTIKGFIVVGLVVLGFELTVWELWDARPLSWQY